MDQSPDTAGRFDRWRARVGFVLAPLVFSGLLIADLPALTPQAHRLAAVMATVVVLWICESLPLPMTAMLGAAACVLLRVAKADVVFRPFADQLMFLFIGSFILARAIFLHGLDRRVAYAVLSLQWVGQRPGRILFAFGAVTAFISAWISNTATTAMMYAIGLSLIQVLRERPDASGRHLDPRYATAMMLITSFAASVGGLATPIGTPPNVIGLGQIRKLTVDGQAVEITFLEWTLVGVPLVAVLYLFMYAYFRVLCPAGIRELHGTTALIGARQAELGPWTRGQVSTVIAWGVTVTLWVAPGIVALVAGESSEAYLTIKDMLPEGVPAILGAALLFVLPGQRGRKAIEWREAVQIDWGVVFLYGGGFALGVLASDKDIGLAAALGHALMSRLPDTSELTLLIAASLFAVVISETTSNTASASIVVPTAISLATAAGVDPVAPALGATFAASLGFMLPVSTPCNAIVYGSGLIPIGKMIRYGLLLDIAGVIVVVTLVHWLAPLVH